MTQILWYRQLKKGWLRKKITAEELLNEDRFIVISHVKNLRRVISLPLISEVTVLNRRTENHGSFTSYYTRATHSRFGGGQMGGTAQQYGDVHLHINNQKNYTIQNTPDPQGLRDLIKSLVRECVRRQELA